MTQPDYSAFQVGGVVFPIPTGSGNPTLRDADPALYFALDFWTFVIRHYGGARLLAELSASGVLYANQPIADAVAQSYPAPVLPEELENQYQFPLLCAYRKRAQTNWRSVGYETDSWAIEVQYILPPLDSKQRERVLPLLSAIAKALRRKSTDAWDPSYTPPGGQPGDQFTSGPFANVEEMGFGTDRYPQKSQSDFAAIEWLYGEASGVYFPALTLQAYVRERDMYKTSLDGPAQFAGADITGNVAADDGTVAQATATSVVRAATQNPPTLVSLSTTSGTSAGGTSVTLNGALFLSGPPVVFFGPATNPQYAASVAYVSSAQLVVVTPPMQGDGTVDVTVVNRDGQSGTLPKSFTFV